MERTIQPLSDNVAPESPTNISVSTQNTATYTTPNNQAAQQAPAMASPAPAQPPQILEAQPSTPVASVPAVQSSQALALTPPNTLPLRHDLSSIYPDATHGTGVTTPPVQAAETVPEVTETLAHKPERTKFIIAGIWLIGAFIAIPAALSIFGIVRILGYGGGAVGSLAGAVDILYVLVGIGIALRKEMARVVYVVLAVIGLIFSVIGTFNYLAYTQKISSQQASATAQAQQTIVQTENNKSLSASERQRIVQNVQNNLALEKKTDQASEVGLLNLIPDYLIALVPLIFLTRQSVKDQFN